MEFLTSLGYKILGAFSVPGTGEIFLTLAFIFTTVVLLGLFIRSEWGYPIKAAAISLAAIFYILIYFSIIGMQGWPTEASLPEDVEVVWGYVDPPNKKIGKDGFIVLWVLDRTDESIGKKPRAHLLPYTKEMHKKIEEAKKEQQKGKKTGAKRRSKDKGKKGFVPPDATEKQDLMFYKLPPLEVPTK
jgi:hypothetical protein